MSQPAQKCENNECYFKQNNAQKVFIAFKISYSCCFGLRGKSRFSRFPPKKSFITSTTAFIFGQAKLVVSAVDFCWCH